MHAPEPEGNCPHNFSPVPIRCHFLVCLKHWFFRQYILVAAFVLAGGLAAGLYIANSTHTDYWKVIVAIITGLFSLTYFIQKQKLQELELFTRIFAKFNTRYDRLNDELNRIRETDVTSPLPKEDRDTLFKYFNLYPLSQAVA